MTDGNGEFKGQMKAVVQYLEKRIDAGEKKDEARHKEIKDLIAENREVVLGKMNDHNKYHDENEYKWGVWTLFKRFPFIPIVLFLSIGSTLGALGFKLKVILKFLVSLAK